tara:strand:+ start:11964 stop:12743 length:780 start_codon:yes stop_codon:yes gene_type:complete
VFFKVEELAQQIQKYDEAYRAGNPLISDAMFDELRATLVNIDPKHPILLTPGGGSELLSLANYSFVSWYKNLPQDTPVIVQPKIDGCAVALRYKYGRLVKAWNRKGKDVTMAMRKIKILPQQIEIIDTVEIRGELYGLTGHTKSQRLAAGHLRRKSPTGEGLAFCAFEIMGKDTGNEINTLNLLADQKFETCDKIKMTTNVIQKVKTLHDDWKDSLLFNSYPTDGLVVKVFDHKLQHKLGCSSSAPRWAIAVKSWLLDY